MSMDDLPPNGHPEPRPQPAGPRAQGPPPAPGLGGALPPAPPAPLPAPPPDSGPSPLTVALGIALISTLYIWNSWSRDFWAPEEPDFALVAKEMAERARLGEPRAWLVPKIGGELYAEKPPLIYWCALISSWISGGDPRLDYRLPVAFFAGLGLWVTYLAARRFFGGRIAAAAVLIQASSVLYIACGSWLLTDMIFSTGCGLAVMALGLAITSEERGLRWAVAGWAGLSLAALSKSILLSLALVLGPLGLFILLNRKETGIRRQIARMRPLAGILLFLAIVLPWYAAMYRMHGSEFLGIHFGEHHLSRLFEAESHRHDDPFYYLETLPGDFLPWTILLPLAVFFAKANFRKQGPRFFASWALFTLLFLSPISSKQGKYILPMWPALSILAGAAFLTGERDRESIWEGFLGEGLLKVVAWLLKVPVAVAVATFAYWAAGGDLGAFLSPFEEKPWRADALSIISDRDLMLKILILATLASAAFYAAGAGIGRSLASGRPGGAVASLAAALLFGYFAFSYGFADMNRFKSARTLGAAVADAVGSRPLAIYGRDRAAFRYYLDRPLNLTIVHIGFLKETDSSSEEKEELDRYLSRGEKVFLILGTNDLQRLFEIFPVYRDRIRVVPEFPEGLRFSSRDRAVLATNGAP